MLQNCMKSRQELLMVTHLSLICHKIQRHTNLTHTWFYQLIILNDIFQLLFSLHENKTLNSGFADSGLPGCDTVSLGV